MATNTFTTPEIWDCQDLADDLYVIAELMREDYDYLAHLMGIIFPEQDVRGYGMADDVIKAADKLHNLVERMRNS